MWPFSCKKCPLLVKERDYWVDQYFDSEVNLHMLRKTTNAQWISLSYSYPPTNTNILVANKDFTFIGFLYYEDGWDNSRKINMHNKEQLWATYTNTESISWWLNLDLIKKDSNEHRKSHNNGTIHAPSISSTNQESS